MERKLNINKLIKWSIYSIFILIPIITNINSETIQFNIVPTLLKEFSAVIILTLIFILWAIKTIISGKVSYKKSNIYLPILAFITYSGISYFFVVDTVNFFQYYVEYILYATIFLILFNFFNEKNDSNFLINIYVFSGFYISLFGIIQYNFPYLIPVYDVTNGGAGFGNKNFGAQYVTLMLPLLFLKIFISQTIQKSFIYFCVLFTSLLYLFYVGAFQTMIALCFYLIFFVFFYLLDKFKNKEERFMIFSKSVIIKVFVGLVVVFLSYNLMKFLNGEFESSPELQTFTEIVKDDPKGSIIDNFKSNERVPMWINSLQMFKDFPIFGVGTGQWNLSYFNYANKEVNDALWTYTQRADHPHNEYIKLLVEQGMVGVLVASVFFIIVFVQIYKYLLNPSSVYRAEVFSFFSSFLIFTTLSIFSRLTAVFVIPFLGFSFLGLAFSFLNNDYKTKVFENKFKAFLIFPTIAIIFVLYIFIDRLIQDYLARNIKDQDLWVKQVSEYEPFLPQHVHNIAVNLTRLGYHDLSIKKLSNLEIYQPNDIETMRLMANNYVFKGDLKNGLKLYERILTINPTNHIILRAIAQLMYEIKELKHAKHYFAHLKRVLEKNFNGDLFFEPKTVVWHQVVNLAMNLKDFKYAIYILEKSFEYAPTNKTPLNLSLLGILYFNTQNDFASAKKALDEAINIDPSIVDQIPMELYTQLYNENSIKK